MCTFKNLTRHDRPTSTVLATWEVRAGRSQFEAVWAKSVRPRVNQ
jgi:hypothetical protein